MRKTCDNNERLYLNDDILSLAEKILPGETLNLADGLSIDLCDGKKTREQARAYLMSLIIPPPKRPLYYCHYEIRHLPRWTRDTVRYLGDYIDLLERIALKKFLKENYRQGFSPKKVREKLKKFISEALSEELDRYDAVFWKPSKHDFYVDETLKRNRFTSREVVYCIFITLDLSKKIKEAGKFEDIDDPHAYLENNPS
jgi:hypothetical protein